MAETLTHKDRTHARILDEAASAMRLHGADGISVAKLMKRAGLTHGGFYAHFASRDVLVADAVERMLQDNRSLVEGCLNTREAAKGVCALIDAYLSERVKNAPERACPFPALAGEAVRMPAPARARFNEGVALFRRMLASTFEALGKHEPQALASSVLAEMVGAMALARAASDEEGKDILASSRRLLKERLELN
jgi:TetR/AcrR family transcriptional repressor of nem operon